MRVGADPKGDVLGDGEPQEVLLLQVGAPLLRPLIVTPLPPLGYLHHSPQYELALRTDVECFTR